MQSYSEEERRDEAEYNLNKLIEKRKERFKKLTIGAIAWFAALIIAGFIWITWIK